jgi:hypothetical protein
MPSIEFDFQTPELGSWASSTAPSLRISAALR